MEQAAAGLVMVVLMGVETREREVEAMQVSAPLVDWAALAATAVWPHMIRLPSCTSHRCIGRCMVS